MNATESYEAVLTSESFLEFINANELVVIRFWASWNAYDNQLKQTMITHIIGQPEFSKVVFASFDTGPPKHHEICDQLHILNLPYLAVYRQGLLIKGKVISKPIESESVKQRLRRLLEQ